MSFNPNQYSNQIGQYTDQFGQKVGTYASGQLSHGGQGGLLGDAQQKLMGQQIGSRVTNEANQLLHVQPTTGTAGLAGATQAGGLTGGVQNLVGQGAGQLLGQGHQGTAGTQQAGGLTGQVRNFASNEANQLLHGQQATGGNVPHTQQQGGGFVGDIKNYAGNQLNQALHSSGGSGGVQPPSGTQRTVGMTEGATQGTQQAGGFGQQASNFISKQAGGFLHH